MLSLALALAAAPASPQPSPVPVATPGLIATPASMGGLVLPPVPEISPAARAGDTAPPSGDLVGTSGPFVSLSLADAIGMALARNTDLSVAQSNRRIAGYQIVAAEGAYDLQLTIAPNLSYAQIPAISPFQSGPGGAPAQQTSAGISAQIGGLTSTGGHFSAGTSATRINNDTTVNGYNPYYQTALSLMYTQPLARGAGFDTARRQLELAKNNAGLSNDNALLTASNTVASVVDAYYDLLAAWKNVAIQEDALRQAKAQSESNARLVRQGVAAPVDVLEADAQVSVFQDDVFSAIQNVARLQNQLKGLILNNPVDPIWTANLVPTSPALDIPPEPKLDDVILAALRGRPEIGLLRETIRNADVIVRYAREQTKPQLDLNLGLTENGFAGAPSPVIPGSFIAQSNAQVTAINQLIARVNANSVPGQTPLQPLVFPSGTVPPYTVGGLGQAYASSLAGRYPQYGITATLGLPLRNRAALGEYRAALEQRAQLGTAEVALIQRLQVESRSALQAYRSARSRVIAAQAAREAAEQVASSELRKFHSGLSTTFLVLQRQVSLATQRGREVQAQTDLQKALVELDRATGNILTRNQVDVSKLGSAPVPTLPTTITETTR
jgi:HAE1 family hydrophobic/amphiphilic exporter-1